jgi:hypothetical protein
VVSYNVYRSTTSQWAIRENRLPSSLAYRMKIVCWAVAAPTSALGLPQLGSPQSEFLLAAGTHQKNLSP